MNAFMTDQTLRGIPQCPRCQRANPVFAIVGDRRNVAVTANSSVFYRVAIYRCTSCDGSVLAESRRRDSPTISPEERALFIFPKSETISTDIPSRPRGFLTDALNSLNAPSASIMATCSAIDAMLKEKGIGRFDKGGKERSLNKRIEIAVEDGVLTKDMAQWAHKVRLDANDQRHADEDAEPATADQAKSVFELAKGLGEVLFVLPARVAEAHGEEPSESGTGAA